MPDLHLEWTHENEQPQSFAITRDEVTIGRRTDCDLVLPYGFVSGRHARLYREGAAWMIEDLGSTNGTFVNGDSIQKAPVRPGDHLELGRLTLRLRPDESATSDEEEVEERSAEDALEELTTMFPHTVQGSGGLDKLSALLEFQLQWGDRFSAPDLFRAILRHALDLSHAGRGFVLVRGGQEFDYVAGLDRNGTTLEADSFQTSRSVVRKVSEERQPVFMTEGITGDLAEEASIMAMDLRAVACLPLLHSTGDDESEVAGILYLDSTDAMHRLSGLDERILRGLAVEAARVLERMRMLRDREERAHIERDLQLARQTQEELLPRELPRSREWAVQAWCRPTRHVGGDLFDFIERDDGGLVGLLADVAGKGIAASLLSSSVQGAMQAWVRSGLDLGRCVEGLNAYLCERSQDDRFVTLFGFDLTTEGRGVYVNAGHLPAFVYRAGSRSVERLDTRGVVVGILEDMRYSTVTFELQRGDVLLVYSDGVTEAFDRDGEEFGEERLEEVFTRAAAEGLDGAAAALDDALAAHLEGTEPSDDVTVVLVQRLVD